mgnify:FL=1
MSRILGIDFGSHRIGLALSDETGIIAMPFETVPGRDVPAAIRRIKEVCVEKEVSRIVVGLPLNMNGTAGPAAVGAEEFAKALRAGTGIEVVMSDERLSTAIVERMLIEADTRRDKRKQVRDPLAAQVILQGYLDRMSSDQEAL